LQIEGAIPQGRDGSLYGVSQQGGALGIDTVFSMSPVGTETTLYSFDGTNGSYATGGLTLGSDGNFYGATNIGGTSNLGVVYRVTSTGTVTTLHNFTGSSAGAGPGFAPTQGTDGNYYGAAHGDFVADIPVIYKLTPTGVFTTLHTLTVADGYNGGSLTQGTDGNFYGLGRLEAPTTAAPSTG
jgi:uncharacterized repeat protein (TIGR03803 family)